jgi:hypothetical protein
MTTRQLRLLGVPCLQLVPDAVEELHVALLRVLLERRDEGPRHGSGRLRGDCGVGSASFVSHCQLAGVCRMCEMGEREK